MWPAKGGDAIIFRVTSMREECMRRGKQDFGEGLVGHIRHEIRGVVPGGVMDRRWVVKYPRPP
jgi:hypothetical protein